MKILAISDIHGRAKPFANLINLVDKREGLHTFQRIVFLGDYVGYGNGSSEVLDMLMDFNHYSQCTTFLKGNWEDMIWKLVKSNNQLQKKLVEQIIRKRGQGNLVTEIQNHKEKWLNYLEFIQRMQLFHIEKDYVFAHSGVSLDRYKSTENLYEYVVHNHTREDLLWDFNFYTKEIQKWVTLLAKGVKTKNAHRLKIVAGHVPISNILGNIKDEDVNEPFKINNVYGIDFGGSRKTGKLGAVVFSEEGTKTYLVPTEE